MKPKAVEQKEISQTQWDFSKCPEAELSFCVAYEYLRQVALLHRKRLGKKWSPLAFAEMFKGYFHNGKRYEFKGLVDGLNNPFEINLAVKQTYGLAASACSGFPDSPYLKLPVEERQRLIKVFSFDRWRPDQPTMAQETFVHIFLEPKAALELYQYHIAEWTRQNLGQSAPERWIVDYDGFGFELGVIRLNWASSDKQMIEAFKDWLKNNRPADVKRHETRGSAKMSEYLKYLSALRLLTVMSATEAADFTQKICGESLYGIDDNWYDARKKANQFMRDLSSPFFSWADK